MEYCGFFSGRLGSDNQTRGLILEAETDKKVPVTRDKLLKSPDGQPLDRSRYADEASFKKTFLPLWILICQTRKSRTYLCCRSITAT